MFAEKPLDSGPQKAVQREPTQRTVARFERRLDDSRRLLNPVKVSRVLVCVSDESIWNDLKKGCGDCLERVQVHRVGKAELEGIRGNGHFVFVVDDKTAKRLPEDFRSKNPGSKVVMLTKNWIFDHHDRKTDEVFFPQTKKVDFVFGLHVTGVDHGELAAMTIRACEDLMNIEREEDMGAARVRRFIFLIVDDEPRWFSQFLPVLYEIIGTRASGMIARTYKEAEEILEKHGRDVICVVTDMRFPKEGKDVDYPAGKDLVELVKGTFPRIPVIVASTEEWSENIIGKTDFFIKKGTGSSLGELRTFVHDFTGMGDFVFLDKEKREVARAGNLRGLCRAVSRLYPVEILDSYAERDMFSTWLYMHGFNEIADVVKPIHFKGEKLRAVLLRMMSREARRVKGLHLIIGRDDGTRLVIRNLEDLLAAVEGTQKLTDRELERCGEADRIATWLTLKGNTHLADRMRVLHSHTERVREKMAEEIRKEMKEGVGISGGKT